MSVLTFNVNIIHTLVNQTVRMEENQHHNTSSKGPQNSTLKEQANVGDAGLKTVVKDLGCCSVVEYLPSICEALGLIPSTEKKKKKNDEKK